MTQESAITGDGLGLCVTDFNVWVSTPDRRVCLLCGKPPTYFIPVTDPAGDEPGPAERSEPGQAPPATTTIFGAPCPGCGVQLEAEITAEFFTLRPAASTPLDAERPSDGPADAAAGPRGEESAPPTADAEPWAGPASAAPNGGDEHTASLADPPAGALADVTAGDELTREPVEPIA